jgi:hypothetical protein
MTSSAELAAFAAVCERDPGDGQQVELASQVLDAKERGGEFWNAVVSQLTRRAASYLDYHFGAVCAGLRAAIRSTMTPAELAAVVQDREPSWQIQPDTRWNPAPPPPPPVEPISPERLASLVHEAMRKPDETMTALQHALRATVVWDNAQSVRFREHLTPDERAYVAFLIDHLVTGLLHPSERNELASLRRIVLVGMDESEAAELMAAQLERWRCGPQQR